jgi:ATP-dependent exoDNAse (exonuclease V) alpha subunit
MKVIITKNLYPKIRIVNGTIGYVQNISFAKSHWIQYDELMHLPINVLIDFNEIIQNHETLQDITLEGLPKNVIPITPITRNFQYHHFVQESNTFKTFNISQYQLPLAPTFCLTNFKAQGQTFECLIIDLCQPPNNVQLNMHNIYVTLSHLRSFDGVVLL